jgi:hypothetical protein
LSAKKQTAIGTDPRDDVKVYIGPTLHRRVLVASSVFRGGLSPHVTGLIEKIPELGQMIVPLDEVVEAKRRIKEPGTTEHGLCQYLISIRFNENGEVRE